MVLLLNLLVFVTVVIIVFALVEIFSARKNQVSQRLSEIQKIKGDETVEEVDELKKPVMERLIVPFFQNLGESIGNLTPREIRSNIERKIVYAGSPKGLTFNRLITSQLVLAGIMFFGPFALFSFLLPDMGRTLFLSILLGLFGFIFPIISVQGKARKRQEELQKSLPDVLDLILVSVEAGLGFDMALKRVGEQAPGALSREFSRAMEEIRMGKEREWAFRNIVKRTGVADLSSFITAVIQSEQLGTNIANTLRVQAATMRQKRRQRAEETAMKAPIKMLFPLVFFIFPTMFVVLLGPAIISLMQAFGSMF